MRQLFGGLLALLFASTNAACSEEFLIGARGKTENVLPEAAPPSDANPDSALPDRHVPPSDANPDSGLPDRHDADGAPPDGIGPPDTRTDPPVGCWDQPRKSNVLVLVYNPYLVGKGHSLRAEVASWNDPAFLSVRIAEHVRNVSHGFLNYKVVEFRELTAWPKQRPGTAPLDETTYFNGLPPGKFEEYEGGNADYGDIFESQDLCNYVTTNDVSEIWLWGSAGEFQDFGFDLFAYRFKDDVLPVRSPTDDDRRRYDRRRKNIPDCHRTVWVLGFTYTYGYDPRLYNMRIEEILNFALRGAAPSGSGADDPFSRFARFALDSPDDVQVGTTAFPPNGGLGRMPDERAWDYENHTMVESGADDWYQYPALTGAKKPIDCTAWGCSNPGFQAWYAAHLPHVGGGSIESSCNNWWKYIADSDGRLATCSGSDCSPNYPNGQACTADAQCASRHCRCQGSKMLCSDTAGPVCPNPSWDPCLVDEDCLSGVCGCNGAPPPKVCLPDERYPRDCAPP